MLQSHLVVHYQLCFTQLHTATWQADSTPHIEKKYFPARPIDAALATSSVKDKFWRWNRLLWCALLLKFIAEWHVRSAVVALVLDKDVRHI